MPCVPLIMLAIATTPPTQSSSASAPKRRIRVRSAWGRRDRQGIEAKTKRDDHFAPPAHRTADRRRVRGPGLECDGTQRILWRQFANGGANESDENSPALATISRHGVARCVSSSLLRHHISPSDNTARTALLTLSVRRAGVVADLVLVFRRSAEPAQGANPCTNRAQDVPGQADIHQYEPDDLSRSASSERTSWTSMDAPDRSGAT